MVFSGNIGRAVTTGAVPVSDAAFTNVVLAFVILIEDGEDRIAKSPWL